MAIDDFIYTIVVPASTILAYKRIPIDNLLLNGIFWAVPLGLGMYVLVGRHTTGWKLWSAIVAMLAIYAVVVYVGDRVETWLVKRKQG